MALLFVLVLCPPAQAATLGQARVGLERNYKNAASIKIANTRIVADGQVFQSSDGFTARVENETRVALYSGGAAALLADVGQPITVSDADGGPVSLGGAKYRGAVAFGRFDGPGVTAVNILPADEYLYGVVAAEMAAHFHPEALKAQAVAARSYMLMRAGSHAAQGYDLCDQGHCQAYRGMGQEHDAAVSAVAATQGIVMYYDGEPINAVYFSSSGGATDASEYVWNEAVPYLRAKTELAPEYEPRVWSRFFTWGELTALLTENEDAIGAAKGMAVTRTGPTGRVQELTIYGASGQVALTKEDIRAFFSPSDGGMLESRNFVLGENFVPAYAVTVTDGAAAHSGPVDDFYGVSAGNAVFTMRAATVWDGVTQLSYEAAPPPAQASGGEGVRLSGSGWGHGVGMSQRGAEGMARQGYNFLDILNHYYTGVVMG